MPTQDPSPPIKTRILTHMNADHTASLSLYLQHYHHLPAPSTLHAQLTNISLTHMEIQTPPSPKKYQIPFLPPLQSWAEVRSRVVELDSLCKKSLQTESQQPKLKLKLDTYIPPTSPFHIFVFAAVVLLYVLFFAQTLLVGSEILPASLLAVFPGGREAFGRLVTGLGWSVLGIHALEVVVLDLMYLRRVGVERGTGVWWAWVGSCAFEGFACMKRVEGWVVEEERRGKGGKGI